MLRHYLALLRLHGDGPSFAGLDGEGAAAGGCAGRQCGGCRGPRAADARLRAHLLLGYLSVRHHAGHLRMAGQAGQEEPLHLLESTVFAPSRCVHGIPYPAGAWLRHPRSAAGPLLCLRAHSHQPAATRLAGRKQCAGSHCRTLRQLCLLPLGGMATLRHLARHCRSDAGRSGRASLAKRPYLVQHHLSGGHRAEHLCQVLVAEDTLRRRPMQELLAVHEELQGLVHRLQEPYGRLYALRDLRRLHREL